MSRLAGLWPFISKTLHQELLKAKDALHAALVAEKDRAIERLEREVEQLRKERDAALDRWYEYSSGTPLFQRAVVPPQPSPEEEEHFDDLHGDNRPADVSFGGMDRMAITRPRQFVNVTSLRNTIDANRNRVQHEAMRQLDEAERQARELVTAAQKRTPETENAPEPVEAAS